MQLRNGKSSSSGRLPVAWTGTGGRVGGAGAPDQATRTTRAPFARPLSPADPLFLRLPA